MVYWLGFIVFVEWFIGLDLLYLLNGLLNGLLCVIVEECSHTGLRGRAAPNPGAHPIFMHGPRVDWLNESPAL